MNTNKFFKENSTLLIVIAVVLLIVVFFWWNGKGDVTQASANINQGFVEAPVTTPEIIPAPVPTTPAAPTAPAPAVGNIEWCAQINGLQGGHLPHLLNLGTNTAQGGQNWFSLKTATGAEDWGILSDGTYFIKKPIVDKAAAQLGVQIISFQVKTGENNWSAPKPGVLGTVAGQPAWVFK